MVSLQMTLRGRIGKSFATITTLRTRWSFKGRRMIRMLKQKHTHAGGEKDEKEVWIAATKTKRQIRKPTYLNNYV